MRISISLPKENMGVPYIFSFVTSTQELEIDHAHGICGDILVDGNIVYTGSSFRAVGEIRLERKFQCDRCLRSACENQRVAFEEEYKEAEDVQSGLEVVFFSGETIDLSECIRETILLSQPLNNICSETCKGLCTKCGADLNKGECGCDRHIIDPRLAALQKFFTEK